MVIFFTTTAYLSFHVFTKFAYTVYPVTVLTTQIRIKFLCVWFDQLTIMLHCNVISKVMKTLKVIYLTFDVMNSLSISTSYLMFEYVSHIRCIN